MGNGVLNLSRILVLPHWIVSAASTSSSEPRLIVIFPVPLPRFMRLQIYSALGNAQQAEWSIDGMASPSKKGWARARRRPGYHTSRVTYLNTQICIVDALTQGCIAKEPARVRRKRRESYPSLSSTISASNTSSWISLNGISCRLIYFNES